MQKIGRSEIDFIRKFIKKKRQCPTLTRQEHSPPVDVSASGGHGVSAGGCILLSKGIPVTARNPPGIFPAPGSAGWRRMPP